MAISLLILLFEWRQIWLGLSKIKYLIGDKFEGISLIVWNRNSWARNLIKFSVGLYFDRLIWNELILEKNCLKLFIFESDILQF